MRRTILFSIPGLLLVATLCAHAQTPPVNPNQELVQHRDATASELVRLISTNLDKAQNEAWKASPNAPYGSWEVTYQPQYDRIEVQLNEEVLIPHEVVFNDSPGPHKPTLGRPSFSFEVEPLISTAEYARLKAENEVIDKQVSQMQVQMKGIGHKFDSYRPKNDTEKQLVDAYNKLKKSRHSLPDFYFRDISLSWFWFEDRLTFLGGPGENPPFVTATNEKSGWHREQANAAQAVLRLLSHYEPESK